VSGPDYAERFVAAADGLRLFARDYGGGSPGALPVVCLPGLSRNSADFHELALALATDPDRPRRVLALDYRGRGRSEYDPDPRKYDVTVELGDVVQVLTALDVGRAIYVGTSRGGLITMALAATRPGAVAGAVLNDIGPVLEAQGLVRIRGYVGKLPDPRDYAEAGRLLKGLQGDQFPGLAEARWEHMARSTWKGRDGALVPNYDRALLTTLEGLDLEAPLPSLWPLFEKLSGIPVLAIRGELSDLLSAETLAAMATTHPSLTAITVPDQGHAPLLDEPELIEAIRAFARRIDDVPPQVEEADPRRSARPSNPPNAQPGP
jgi:pimeloyl-ACP methyl ester carboxylesterase